MNEIYYIECEVISTKKVRSSMVQAIYKHWIIAPTKDLNSLAQDDRRIKALKKRLNLKEKETVSFGEVFTCLPLGG